PRARADGARDRRAPAGGARARRGPRGRVPLRGAAMSAVDAASPARLGTLGALHRLVLRTQVSVPRLPGIATLSGCAILIGVFARYADDPGQAAVDGIASYGLAILVPLAALWLGTSALGDLVEDRLLVYLWLKPVS